MDTEDAKKIFERLDEYKKEYQENVRKKLSQLELEIIEKGLMNLEEADKTWTAIIRRCPRCGVSGINVFSPLWIDKIGHICRNLRCYSCSKEHTKIVPFIELADMSAYLIEETDRGPDEYKNKVVSPFFGDFFHDEVENI